jgi:hypothetical protein
MWVRILLFSLAVGTLGCAALQRLDETHSTDQEAAQETIDLHDFDTGQYGGVVLEDPEDKRNIQGFVHLALIWGTRLKPGFPRAMAGLAEAVNTYTHIRAKVTDHIFLNSSELFRKPFVYITAVDAFDLTAAEIENLGRYMKNGGFVLVDNGRPDLSFGAAEAALRNMFTQALGNAGKPVNISNHHPIYHSFFDLNGPPFGGERTTLGNSQPDQLQQSPRVDFLEGFFVDGRLVAVYSDMGYGAFWERSYENEPQLKMGVNLVVYALTRQGSLAMPLDALLPASD